VNSEPEVTISQGSRVGSLSYRESDNELLFDWEIGGSVVALIWGTKRNDWDSRHPWAAGRQPEIYNFVAKEVIRQKAPTSSFNIELESGTITIL
jgi:hypothetical protein